MKINFEDEQEIEYIRDYKWYHNLAQDYEIDDLFNCAEQLILNSLYNYTGFNIAKTNIILLEDKEQVLYLKINRCYIYLMLSINDDKNTEYTIELIKNTKCSFKNKKAALYAFDFLKENYDYELYKTIDNGEERLTKITKFMLYFFITHHKKISTFLSSMSEQINKTDSLIEESKRSNK